jgi:LacI family transcriptional regulator
MSVSRETTNFDHIESIISKGVPMVFFDRVYENPLSSKVIVDDFAGAKEETLHLIEQGFKRIAHLEGPPNLVISTQRLEGYKEALQENDMPVLDELVVACPFGTLDEGRMATEKLLMLKNPPDAIFASNDPAAMGAMQAIKERGLKIPHDVAVVGFSNWFFSALMEPPLTSVDQPGFEMGQEAAKLLIRQIEKQNKDDEDIVAETKLLKTRLIIRASSLKPKK